MVRKDLRGGDGVGAAQGETGGQSSLRRIGLQKRGGERAAAPGRGGPHAARFEGGCSSDAARRDFQALPGRAENVERAAPFSARGCRNPRRSIGNRDCTIN